MTHVRRLEIYTNERISGTDVTLISQLTDFTRVMIARTLNPRTHPSTELDKYNKATWMCGKSNTAMDSYQLVHTSYTGQEHSSKVLRLTRLGSNARPAMLTRLAFTRLMAMRSRGESLINSHHERLQVFLDAMATEDYDYTTAREETLSRIMDVMVTVLHRLGDGRVVGIRIRDVPGSTLFVINYMPPPDPRT